jgi:hypothetical protein
MSNMLDEKRKVGRPSKSARRAEVLTKALERFHRIESASRDDRELSRNDRRFGTIPGAMWEEPMLAMTFAAKPRFELSYIMGARIRMEGEYRANRPAVTFMPRDVGNAANDELAEALNGLFRADWDQFHGDGAGGNGFSEMILGGMGALHVQCVPEDPDDEDCERQRIAFKPVVDADISVYYDLDAKDQEKRDATHAFKVFTVTRSAFAEMFPGHDPATWPVSTETYGYDWCTPDVVKLADYYVVEHVKVQTSTVKPLLDPPYQMTDDELDDEDHDADGYADDETPPLTQREILTAQGCVITPDAKPKRVKQIRKYLMSGGAILEDYGPINGTEIPLPVLYGIRDWVDGKERWQGIVRVAADAQRVVNMGFSRLVELSATGAAKQAVFTPEEMVGHGASWATRNIEAPAYLLRNRQTSSDGSMLPTGPIEWTPTPEIDQATAGVLQLSQSSLKEILGHKEQHANLVGGVTGKAIELQQVAKDVMSLIYLDQAKQFMQRVGECWLSAAVDVYVEPGRKMKTIGADMKTRGSITLGEPGVDDDGNLIKRYDLSRVKFDVIVDVGPSTVTKRAAIVSALTNLLMVIPQDDPETRQVVTAALLANMEGEGLAALRGYFRRKLVRMGVEKPTEIEQAEIDKEKAAAGPPQPGPQDLALLALAEKEKNLAVKAQADTALSQANAQKALAQTAKTEAERLEIVADLDTRTGGGQVPPTR